MARPTPPHFGVRARPRVGAAEARITAMETLGAKPTRSPTNQRERLAFAHGARSAFDMSGFSTFHDRVFRPRSLERSGPGEMIARDFARVMHRFGRSAACARRALEAGVKIEDLEPGCTTNGDSPRSPTARSRNTSHSRGPAPKSVR